MPTCTIIAGPNGAGKSTIYSLLDLPGDFINADEIARALNPLAPDAVSLQAGREVLRLLESRLLTKTSFSYETTLSSHQSIKILRQARLGGYRTQLLFVALANADLHVQRVKDRVMKGGHDIPEYVIRRRYDTAFDNLVKAIPLSDEIAILDNSYQQGPITVAELREGQLRSSKLSASKSFDRRVAACIATGLGLSLQRILKTS